jgi:quinol monooxygenase YgiN
MAAASPAYLAAKQTALDLIRFRRHDFREAVAGVFRRGFGLAVGTMQVSWWVEVAVRPGCLDDFEKLTGEMVSSTRAERGVLAYQRFISDDQQTVYVHERYEDSDAAMAHLHAFAAIFGERYASMVDRKRFVVFGEPSNELRTILDRYGATYHRPFGWFPYWG